MRILLASSIDPQAIDRLSSGHEVIKAFNASEEELISKIAECNVIVFRSGVQITREVISAAGNNLKLIIRAGSGLDNIDMEYVNQNKIPLERIYEPGAWAVAELSFALMLALARKVVWGDKLLREGHWAKNQLKGHLLTGKTLGIIGAGNIGSRTANFGRNWGMQVIGCVEHPSEINGQRFKEQGFDLVDIESVLRNSDFVSIHVPLKESTINLISDDELSLMKDGAYLANLARGGVVDEQALYRHLTREGGLAGAALDVHKQEGEGKISPLAELNNVVLTPHIGAMTIDSQKQIGERVIEIIGTLSN